MQSTRIRVVSPVIAALLSAATTGCDLTDDDRPSPEELATSFARSMSDGDYEGAADLTDDPAEALNDLAFIEEQLHSPVLGYTVTDVESSVAEGTASYQVSLNVLDQPIDYHATAQLITDDEGEWKIDWTPAVIHPELASDRHLEIVPSVGPAPTVLDRNGQPILSEQLVTVVRIDPAAVVDRASTATSLASALHPVVPTMTAESVLQQIEATSEAFTLVALRPEAASTVSVPELPGVSQSQQSRLLSAAPGLRSPALSGLKKVWEEAATQSTGWSLQVQDSTHDTVATVVEVSGSHDPVVSTTFDATIHAAAQAAVDEITAPGQQAVIVAIQPSTGGVLTVAQNAAADAEGPIALTGLYPPGSTFKIVSTAAVLSAGAAAPDSVLPCPGKATIKGRTIPNDEKFDLGSVPLHTAFANSCNTTIATLTATLPADSLHTQALRFGIGVDYVAEGITTITGRVPVAESDAQLVEDSIGQGKVVASPFAMALVAATVANGSTPLPVIVSGATAVPDQTAEPPPAEVIKALRAMMQETVTGGTATSLKDLDELAGKTGTAQYGDGTHSHGWFVGYYKDLAFAVLVTGADSSKPAVAVAGDFLRSADDRIPE